MGENFANKNKTHAPSNINFVNLVSLLIAFNCSKTNVNFNYNQSNVTAKILDYIHTLSAFKTLRRTKIVSLKEQNNLTSAVHNNERHCLTAEILPRRRVNSLANDQHMMSWSFRCAKLLKQNAIILVFIVLCALLTNATAETSSKRPRITKPPVTRGSPASPTTAASTTTTSSTTAIPPTTNLESIDSSTDDTETVTTIPDLCIHGLKLYAANTEQSEDEEETPKFRHEREFVHVIEGDAMLSILTKDPTSALFVVNRVNEANILEADFKIGMRAISVENDSLAESLLIQEVQYLQQCITHGIGIFIDHELYQQLNHIINDLEYNIWPIPSTHSQIFPKVAHLLYQMPWGDQIAAVEILSDSLDVFNDFMDAVRHEHMCLMHFKSEQNIYILLGSKIAENGKENGTIFAIPTERTDRALISALPDKSFVLMENEINLQIIDENSTKLTLNEVLLGKTVLPSRVLTFARTVLHLVHWLKNSLQENCKRVDGTYRLETCSGFLKYIEDWESDEENSNEQPELAALLDQLRMRKLANAMIFKIYQKRIFDDQSADLLEIASQNFITNVTTYFHYNRANKTSLELKTKFGQVFNCQYSAGENARYPFLFDGESVMFWRIKPDAWVATGFTASILGIIVTLAILVFIIVRISLGDVFEGNPVTSILLLLSLILMFTSFVPFSLEYVGEHPNSHITFEDAEILNTLCAVRVFIMTLVYCFTFSLLLCRAVMLASIGSEGGFLSHVNGYIQAVICIFSICVQLGMSIQFLVVMHIASEMVSCENIYYGNWFSAVMAYDFILLLAIVSLVPFIYRSQRNYREGILIVIGAVLAFIIWLVWMVMSFFGDELRDAAIALGLQATGWAILVGILIPRTFLIVRGIERSDIAQALPSLTSLAFAQNNQYSSEQSVYECVNPAMRHCSQEEMHQSPSEIPTLPLRGGGPRRQQFFANLRQANASINPQRPPPRPNRGSPPQPSSVQSSLPGSPDSSKITRF